MVVEGRAYSTLVSEASMGGTPYGEEAKACIHRTVERLMDTTTSVDRPGMLLGMVQSGKTKTFLGVIALALDNGFDLFIVLTKGTKALATQTTERLNKAFFTIREDDELRVFDIMSLPKLTKYEQARPMVLVAKKQKDNLSRLEKMLCQDYPELSQRRAIIIDDEADFASIGFKRNKNEVVEAQKIMSDIDSLRQHLPNASLLQTTATPYSLYLQPNNLPGSQPVFKPTRPVFTELVPVHDRYIGGKFYFEDSQNPDSLAYYLYCPVDPKKLDALIRPDGRRFKPENALTANSIPVLRKAIVTFVVGGVVRRLQSEHDGGRKSRYSFIIHTEARQGAHQWQEVVVEAVIQKLQEAAETNQGIFSELVKDAYDDLGKSIRAGQFFLPEYVDVLARIQEYLPAVQVEKVNSEKDINQLLDRDGQLELRNPLNIFIGGQILDRGITVANLIGFYYGRRANRFQQDTVLQHSRMYGARPMADLAVTRFYTSPQIYQVLKTIYDFDSGLRTAFENGGHDAGVVFIQQENSRIIPCSPNKVLLSTLMTVGPGKRLLPIGFQTGYKTHIQKLIDEIDARVDVLLNGKQPEVPTVIALEQAYEILDTISRTYEFEEGYEWNVNAIKACLGYVSAGNTGATEKGKLHLLVRRNRDNNRMRADGRRFFDAPDTSHIEGVIARKLGITAPVLILFRQNGLKEKGWRDCPFWWPVIYMPQNMRTVVYANDTYDSDEEVSDGMDDAG